MLKRIASLWLALVIIISYVPVDAFAIIDEGENTYSEQFDTSFAQNSVSLSEYAEPDVTEYKISDFTEYDIASLAENESEFFPEDVAEKVSVTGITLDKTTLALTVGDSPELLTAKVEPEDASEKSVKWESSNGEIATVSESGEVTAVCAGEATITATTVDGDFVATCVVTVVEQPDPVNVTGVTLDHETLELTVDSEPIILVAEIQPNNATNQAVTWKSSDNQIVSVDANGAVTAISSGIATITVETEDGGFCASCTVTVSSSSKIAFERYILTINGVEAPVKYNSFYYVSDVDVNQFDEVTIQAVLSTTSDDIVFEWIRGPKLKESVVQGATDATLLVDTSSYDFTDYQFRAVATIGDQTIDLPSIELNLGEVTKISRPTIIKQPAAGEYYLGTNNSLFCTMEREFVVYHCQWYVCDSAQRTNAQKVAGANSSSTEMDGTQKTTCTIDSSAIGTKWYYCEIYIELRGATSEKVQTDCVPITIMDPKLPIKGSGSSEEPYLITSSKDLETVRKNVEEGNAFVGCYFRLTDNVELPAEWRPIGCTKDGTNDIQEGKNLNAFSGILDGGGFTVTVPAGGLPLFGYVYNATIRNLNIYGSKIAGYGLINNFEGVGLSGNAVLIENVTIKEGTQTLKSGLLGANITTNGFAGVSAGYLATIRNCTVEKGVIIGYTGTEDRIGSFAGRMQGTIENCVSYATVKGNSYVGGIIGTRDNAVGKCSVSNCTFSGAVEATGSFAGGIVGGGYSGAAAPNGVRPDILSCTVDGTVNGNECVGGITGGDPNIAQAWDGYSISGNNFTGKIKGTQYVGAIIGYYHSLNKLDNISGNTYSADCGADKGIDFIKYLDTSYPNPIKMDGTIVINTANGKDNLPVVAGCEWKADHNRTDDPLGKDADKLCKKLGGGSSETPTCYELVVSGTYKTEYTVGEELNLTGIKLTAKWTAGKADTTLNLSDVEVSGYDKNKAGEQTITLSYGSAKAYIKVNVTPKSSKITVSVTIMGDSKHGNNGEIHGLARGGLTTWASASVEADTTNTVWNVLQKVMDDKGITYSAGDNNQYGTIYISAVNGLGEFDNGKDSGWMYAVNGVCPVVGVNAKYVSNNDKIVLFYTDDYTYEQGGVNYGKPVGQVAAEAVDKLIEAIGTVSFTDACKAKIDAARKAYDALSESEKKLVKKLSTLEAAEKKYAELKKADDQKKATAVDNLIAAIGTVTKNSGTKINAAWNAYNALTADQKALVKKLATLQSATSTWNDLMAKEVIDLIEKIGDPVTESSEKAIKDARTAYDKLTNAQKKLVTNYEKLTKAETELAKLVATEDDKKKAQEVIDLIDKLGDITADSEKDVEAARKAYDALTDLQKKLVENYDKLEAAESKLKLLKAMGKVTDPYIATGDYMINLGTPSVGSIGGEWMVIGLLRSDRNVPNLSDYYDSVLKYVEENIDENERLHSAKSTDNSRIILALTAMGKDVTKVGTHNLLAGLNSMDYIKKQGNNGPIWALIALDSGNYPVPEGDVTRQALIDEILRVQTSDGGWAISGDEADADMTGMALTALARYYKKDLRVLAAVDKAIECLSQMQDADGGFSTFSGNGGKVATSESTAQVVVALTALGINPDTDARFVKNGHSAIDALVSYFVNGGGFKHVSNGQLDGMATEQAYYALTAYYRFLEEKTSLYDMTDVIDMGGDPEEIVEETTEPTVPATTEPVEAENGGSFPWAIMVLVLAAGFGGGIATVTLILPRIKKKRF